MELVAFLGKEKEGLGQISALVNRMECEKVLIVKDKNTEDIFRNEKCDVINIDSQKDIVLLKEEMQEKLKKGLTGDFEVALSLASGNGKEHMALISALLSIPVGIKLVVYTKKGVEFIT